MLNKYHAYKNKLRMSADRNVLFEESYATRTGRLELFAVSKMDTLRFSFSAKDLRRRPALHLHSNTESNSSDDDDYAHSQCRMT